MKVKHWLKALAESKALTFPPCQYQIRAGRRANARDFLSVAFARLPASLIAGFQARTRVAVVSLRKAEKPEQWVRPSEHGQQRCQREGNICFSKSYIRVKLSEIIT